MKQSRCTSWALIGFAGALTIFPCGIRVPEAHGQSFDQEIDRRAGTIESRLVAWRRDFHEHPELSNREFRTSRIVADHLRSLGLEVNAPVARTGVVGTLRGGKPGPAVALRADMDALPVTEEVNLPFASKVRATYGGREVGVMHACGHDMHTAILMGVADVLAGMRADIPGTIRFIFQPAEEGAPAGEEGGAGLMIKEGALENPKVSAVFGLHVFPEPLGQVTYRPGAWMAASDSFRILVRGSQTHGAQPWRGADPIVASAQIVLGLQTIVSRQIDITEAPAVISIGSIHGGVRWNIIPDTVELAGTIRSFDPAMQQDIHERIRRISEMIARAAGATAQVDIEKGNPITYNDPELTERMAPTLVRLLGKESVRVTAPATVSEDFSLYQTQVPGLFFFLGITPKGTDPAAAAPNHSPHFYADEGALTTGVRALANLALDFLRQAK